MSGVVIMSCLPAEYFPGIPPCARPRDYLLIADVRALMREPVFLWVFPLLYKHNLWSSSCNEC